MRIISGQYKGRHLTAKLPPGIRPTQDAMRETIFNILNNCTNISGMIVADVCAGTGMLGIEAISRGARFAYFVDKNYKALEHIKAALQTLNVPIDRYTTQNLDALQFINHFGQTPAQNGKLDVLFLDPPYNTTIASQVLIQLPQLDIIRQNGIIVIETAIHNTITPPPQCCLLTKRQFGASKVYFIKMENENNKPNF